MKTKNPHGRFVRLRRYQINEGVTKSRLPSVILPSILASFLVVAGIGFSSKHIDIQELLAERSQNNVSTAAVESPGVEALEQSISKANKLDSQDKTLADAIEEQLETYPDDQQWSVYVKDLNSNRTASVNADNVYDAGSLYKLFLLAPLEKKIPVDQWDYYWAGGYNVSSCLTEALSIDDSDCTRHLGSYINWSFAEGYTKDVGFMRTTLGDGSEPKTSARDVGQFLAHLKTSKVLSDLGRRNIFDILYHQDYRTGIPMACDKCVVANLYNENDDFVHDGGIVTRGDKAYVIVVMSKGGSSKQITQLTRVVDQQLNL